ncbi:hypothetical protein VT98_12213, partial [Candidatus Electrothrix communis]
MTIQAGHAALLMDIRDEIMQFHPVGPENRGPGGKGRAVRCVDCHALGVSGDASDDVSP